MYHYGNFLHNKHLGELCSYKSQVIKNLEMDKAFPRSHLYSNNIFPFVNKELNHGKFCCFLCSVTYPRMSALKVERTLYFTFK